MIDTLRLVLLVLFGALALAGCPEVRDTDIPDALTALDAYRDALARDQPERAFTFIHPEAREGMDVDAFVLLYRHHRDALVEQADELLALTRTTPAVQTARVSTGSGEVALVRTPEGWRLTAPVGSR